jgi:hypothetical protein
MLSWSIFIRYIVIFAIPIVLLYVLLAKLGFGEADTRITSWSDIVINIVTFATYYWYFGKHIADVANKANY